MMSVVAAIEMVCVTRGIDVYVETNSNTAGIYTVAVSRGTWATMKFLTVEPWKILRMDNRVLRGVMLMTKTVSYSKWPEY